MLTRRTRNYRQILTRRVFVVATPLLGMSVMVLALTLTSTNVGHNELRPTATSPATSRANTKIGLPVRLTIPTLNVDAAVGYAGMDADGVMEVSPSQDDVTWYQLGNRPGDKGSAVIAGHYGALNGKYSVFSNISKLKTGDRLQVEDHLGALTSFIVRESRMYNPDADATDVFNSTDNKAHLNLITCEGDWNDSQQTYSERRVVFTDKL